MNSFLSVSHNKSSRRFCRRMIALVQIVVMVMLAVPACCYEIENNYEKDNVGQNQCPCCPDENKTDANQDTCSTCNYCNYYAPLIPLISTNYDPSVAPLIFSEVFKRLPEVHFPIFIPPQNLA